VFSKTDDMLSAAKCRQIILVSGNMTYMRIFTGWRRSVKRQWGCWRRQIL